jgi:lactate racemase
VLVFAPPLHQRLGPRLGPIRLFDDRRRLWRAAADALGDTPAPRVRIFPQGGLTYAPEARPSAPGRHVV